MVVIVKYFYVILQLNLIFSLGLISKDQVEMKCFMEDLGSYKVQINIINNTDFDYYFRTKGFFSDSRVCGVDSSILRKYYLLSGIRLPNVEFSEILNSLNGTSEKWIKVDSHTQKCLNQYIFFSTRYEDIEIGEEYLFFPRYNNSELNPDSSRKTYVGVIEMEPIKFTFNGYGEKYEK
jgi:hypothetical protein